MSRWCRPPSCRPCSISPHRLLDGPSRGRAAQPAGLPRADLPVNALERAARNWFLILPLVALVYLLFSGFTPLFAGTIGLALTALLILGVRIAARRWGCLQWSSGSVFWIGIGLVPQRPFSLRHRRGPCCGIAVLLAVNAFVQRRPRHAVGGGATPSRTAPATRCRSASPARSSASSSVSMTPDRRRVNLRARHRLGGRAASLFLSLVLTMVTCLVLGMGIPTIPNYIITSSIAGPALLELGVPLIVSHMFVFYFGIMADLTPPVALAVLPPRQSPRRAA
jgi:TRAP-type uncharacterized transport system fused permease subunit